MKRRIVDYAQTAACNLVRTGVVVLVATVLLSWTVSLERNGGDLTSARDVPSSLVSKSTIDPTRVRMEVGSGRPYSAYSLEDEEGRELIRVTYSRHGFVIVNLGEVFPLRPGFSARIDGSYDFVVDHEGVNHRLTIRPGGTSGFTIARSSRSPQIEASP
jgi:hypothetical protein